MELLGSMKKDSVADNAARKKEGYPTFGIVGRAAKPRYDAGSHKLYRAKGLAFEGEDDHTLTYNIRMLGREGALIANAVGELDDLSVWTQGRGLTGKWLRPAAAAGPGAMISSRFTDPGSGRTACRER